MLIQQYFITANYLRFQAKKLRLTKRNISQLALHIYETAQGFFTLFTTLYFTDFPLPLRYY